MCVCVCVLYNMEHGEAYLDKLGYVDVNDGLKRWEGEEV